MCEIFQNLKDQNDAAGLREMFFAKGPGSGPVSTAGGF